MAQFSEILNLIAIDQGLDASLPVIEFVARYFCSHLKPPAAFASCLDRHMGRFLWRHASQVSQVGGRSFWRSRERIIGHRQAVMDCCLVIDLRRSRTLRVAYADNRELTVSLKVGEVFL